MNVRAFIQFGSDTGGLNGNVNKLLKFGELQLKWPLTFTDNQYLYICGSVADVKGAERTTNVLKRVQTVFKCFINQLNPELELLILPGTLADQSSQAQWKVHYYCTFGSITNQLLFNQIQFLKGRHQILIQLPFFAGPRVIQSEMRNWQ